MTDRLIGAATPTLAVSIIALATALGSGFAAAIPMDGADDISTTLQQSSFNTGANWLGGAAPAANNVYETAGNRLNSPWNASNSVFLGDRLTVQNSTFALTASNGGIVRIDNNAANPGGLVLSGGTVLPWIDGRRMRLAGLVTLADATLNTFNAVSASRNLTVDAQITGSGDLRIASPAGVGEVLFNSPANDYSGNTLMRTFGGNSSVLRAGAAGVFSPNSVIDMETGHRVILDGHANSVGGLVGSGIVENANSTAAELTIQGGAGSSFAGSLQDGAGGGALSVRKSGSGTQILTTANSYTGSTVIDGGTLKIENADALGAGPVSISGTGTLGLDPVSIGFDFSMEGRADTTAHVLAEDAGNEITSASTVTLIDGSQSPNNYTFATDQAGDTLVINGTISDTSAASDTLNFGGGGTGTVNSAIVMTGAGVDTVAKIGSGDWTLAGAVTADAINVDQGKLVLSGGASTDTANVNDGDLNLESALTTTGNVTVGDGSGSAGTATLSQVGGSFIDRDQQDGGYVVDVDGTVNMNGQAASMNWLSGSGSVTNQAPVDPTLTLGNGTGPTDGIDATWSGVIADGSEAIDVVKDGTNTQTFAGANTYTGGTEIGAGILELTGAGTVGSGAVTVNSTGGTLALNDLAGGARTNVINLFSRNDDSVHLNNVASSNTISGAINLTGPDDTYTITSGSGTLNLSGGVASTLTSGNRVLTLGGAGNGTVSALDFNAASGNSLVKTGTGTGTGTSTWTVNAPKIKDGIISSQGGVLALTGTADLSGSMVYEVLKSAKLDVTGLTGGLAVADTQTLQGGRSTGTDTGGLVDGNVIAASGAMVSPGSAEDATQELRISGDMDLGLSTLEIEINSLSDMDLLAVVGALTIENAILDFTLGGLAAYNTAYVFATYGSQGGGNFEFASITGDSIPVGYEIDYMYNGNQIALVNSNVPTVPVPLPLGLIGIGLLAWGGLRAKQRCAEAKG